MCFDSCMRIYAELNLIPALWQLVYDDRSTESHLWFSKHRAMQQVGSGLLVQEYSAQVADAAAKGTHSNFALCFAINKCLQDAL